jgi:polyhydroxybutyrate depolymerase
MTTHARATIFTTLLLVCLAPNVRAADNPALTPGDHTRKLTVDGKDRSYYVHVPPSYKADVATPVVLCFHGAWMNGPLMAVFCGMNRKADAAGFIVVYPNGTGPNDTTLFFNAFEDRNNRVDDVKFTAKILDDVEASANVDPKRVFATGMSNGGFMCYKLAAEMSERIAAIAPVAGTMAIADAHPKRPVPVLHVHGTADNIVPYDGPNTETGRLLHFSSVDHTIAAWVKLDGCEKTPTVTELSPVVEDGTSVEVKTFGGGKDGAEVVVYAVKNGGHTWPGRPALAFLGNASRNLNANDVIWEFFEKHPMK